MIYSISILFNENLIRIIFFSFFFSVLVIPYATQKYYLNPLYPYNDTMYDDFNDASDDNYDDNYSDKYHDIAKEINVYNNDGKSILDTNRSIDTKTIIKNLHTSTLSFQYVTPSTIMESSMIENGMYVHFIIIIFLCLYRYNCIA